MECFNQSTMFGISIVAFFVHKVQFFVTSYVLGKRQLMSVMKLICIRELIYVYFWWSFFFPLLLLQTFFSFE
jgi:hypothetical protein